MSLSFEKNRRVQEVKEPSVFYDLICVFLTTVLIYGGKIFSTY